MQNKIHAKDLKNDFKVLERLKTKLNASHFKVLCKALNFNFYYVEHYCDSKKPIEIIRIPVINLINDTKVLYLIHYTTQDLKRHSILHSSHRIIQYFVDIYSCNPILPISYHTENFLYRYNYFGIKKSVKDVLADLNKYYLEHIVKHTNFSEDVFNKFDLK